MEIIKMTEKALFYMQIRHFAFGALFVLILIASAMFFCWIEKKNK